MAQRKRPAHSLATVSGKDTNNDWSDFWISFSILNFCQRNQRQQYLRRSSKRRRSGLARSRKRCYSLRGGYITSHLPSSLRNAGIVFVNRTAMCVFTWRKLLSPCPLCLTPEVNPDIDIRSQGQQPSLRPCATQTQSYLSQSIIKRQLG